MDSEGDGGMEGGTDAWLTEDSGGEEAEAADQQWPDSEDGVDRAWMEGEEAGVEAGPRPGHGGHH